MTKQFWSCQGHSQINKLVFQFLAPMQRETKYVKRHTVRYQDKYFARIEIFGHQKELTI